MASYQNQDLFKTLTELKLINDAQLKQAFQFSQEKKLPLDQVLVKQNLIADADLGKIVADLLSLPYINLSQTSIKEKVLKVIPELVARKQKIIVFNIDKKGLHLAMADPKNEQMIEFISHKSGMPIKAYYATARDIADALFLYKKDVNKAFDEIITESVEQAKGSQAAEPPIIKIVETIISYADQNKASDIHIEPTKEFSLVRFRIDGMLHDIIKMPIELHERIVVRVKVLAKLRTDEHQASQDGKLQFEHEDETLDIRVSIVPITEGEKVVMRLLSERSRQFSLPDLGFGDSDYKKVAKAYKEPHGMILATGPTGSGKTTTLYAILKLINRREVNIMTIEDPVEYDVEGINQIQVNTKTELTFAKGLRSIVRQDPDVILVGEIRDEETASIAVNAAMTGHLVLSTLHTNDAATSIPRLLDMKIEPFLVASTVNIIIAQRLVRKICQQCRVSQEQPVAEIRQHVAPEFFAKHFGKKKSIRVYHGKGCPVCHGSGYVGRIGIYEVLAIDEDVRQAIVERKNAVTIRAISVKNGMTTMMEDGLEKVKQGITTIEEVIRVTKE